MSISHSMREVFLTIVLLLSLGLHHFELAEIRAGLFVGFVMVLICSIVHLGVNNYKIQIVKNNHDVKQDYFDLYATELGLVLSLFFLLSF